MMIGGPPPPPPRIRQANRLFIDEKVSISEGYLEKTRNIFDADAASISFGNGSEAQNKINSFVSEKTLGLIPKILKDPPTPDTIMALVNALYFEARWLIRMRRIRSRDRFNAHEEGSGQEAKWISAFDFYGYCLSEALKAQLVLVPYVGEGSFHPLLMVFILPSESLKNSFGKWLSSDYLSWANISAALHSVTSKRMDLTFPEFKIESASELKSALQDLGMKDPFECTAHFGEMGFPEGKVKLSDVFHGAMIEVDEFGTKAAAATATMFIECCASEISIKINRSFIAMIVQHQKGSIVPLFTTVVNKL